MTSGPTNAILSQLLSERQSLSLSTSITWAALLQRGTSGPAWGGAGLPRSMAASDNAKRSSEFPGLGETAKPFQAPAKEASGEARGSSQTEALPPAKAEDTSSSERQRQQRSSQVTMSAGFFSISSASRNISGICTAQRCAAFQPFLQSLAIQADN